MIAAIGRPRRRAGAAVLLILLVVALTTGCTAIPGSSAAIDVTRIADQVEPVVPDAPTPGAGPDQIVRGFIAASARPDSDGGTGASFAAARQYLTPDAQSTWQPSQQPVTILESSPPGELPTTVTVPVVDGSISVR